jgi:hypothetical protein
MSLLPRHVSAHLHHLQGISSQIFLENLFAVWVTNAFNTVLSVYNKMVIYSELLFYLMI